MADFTTSRQQLEEARAARLAAQAEAARAAERKKQLQAALDQASRHGDSDEKARLEAGVKQATEEANAKKAIAGRANLAVEGALEGFATFSDPRRNGSRL